MREGRRRSNCHACPQHTCPRHACPQHTCPRHTHPRHTRPARHMTMNVNMNSLQLPRSFQLCEALPLHTFAVFALLRGSPRTD
eukprot:2310535-Prymnesium_polylepis.2